MSKTICSIFFQPLSTNRPFAKSSSGGFNSRFALPAAKTPEEFHLLIVNDVHEQQHNGSQQSFVTPVYADALALDLITEWRANKIANEYGRPGVFICEGSSPTDAELTRERFIQETWCLKLVNEAESHWIKGDRGLVSELHRDAAKYLGREAYEWVHNTGQVKLMACPFCSTNIDAKAIVCKECGNTIDLDRWLQHQTKVIEAEAKLAELRAKLAVIPGASVESPKLPAPFQPNAPKPPARA